ncbi:hypothetical protein J3459_018076 [Metarhizium acridum]|nr:hypothetical protein J3459_018076 [Metarhizium acridum]
MVPSRFKRKFLMRKSPCMAQSCQSFYSHGFKRTVSVHSMYTFNTPKYEHQERCQKVQYQKIKLRCLQNPSGICFMPAIMGSDISAQEPQASPCCRPALRVLDGILNRKQHNQTSNAEEYINIRSESCSEPAQVSGMQDISLVLFEICAPSDRGINAVFNPRTPSPLQASKTPTAGFQIIQCRG